MTFFRSLVLISGAIAAAALSGCGGGGGGGDQRPRIRVAVDLTGASARSVRLRVFDASGATITGSIVDASGTIDFGPTNSGEVRLLAESYSAAGGGGTLLGTAEQFLNPTASTTLKIAPGATPTGVLVTPTSATITLGGGRRFAAATVSAAGALVPSANSPTWETLGNVATVTPNGVVTATAVGTGSVRATFAEVGFTGAAALTIQDRTTTRSKWTVLVYMNAANDLYTFSPLNVNQMERVAGVPANVRFVVQWKLSRSLYADALFDGTRRYLVKPDQTDAIASQVVQDLGSGVDMGSPQTLSEFIRWGKENYPADRTVVVVWNHGNGWRRSLTDGGRGVSYDDELGTSIKTWELPSALGTTSLDILSWDSSLMQMLEVAYEVRTNAKYVVGSEESPPGEGLPYDRVFAPFRDTPDLPTATLTKAFVDGMLAVPAYATRKITQSSIDTARVPALASAVDTLGKALINNAADVAGIIPGIRSAAQAYSQSGARTYRDLWDVCIRLEQGTSNAAVINAAQNVRAAIGSAVVQEGHNANSPNSHGVSIDFSAGTTFASSITDYRRLQFARDTQWDEFLQQAP